MIRYPIIINSVGDDVQVYADINMLNTILRNLLSNAIKYTNNLGEIEMKTEIKNKKIITTISDNGVGINPEVLNKLFSIEYNITTMGTLNEKGTGLGLLICKEFIEKHSGNIWVESEPGKGSDFKFSLPIID